MYQKRTYNSSVACLVLLLLHYQKNHRSIVHKCNYSILSYLYQICFFVIFVPNMLFFTIINCARYTELTESAHYNCSTDDFVKEVKEIICSVGFFFVCSFLAHSVSLLWSMFAFFFPKCTLVLVKICLKNIFMLDLLRSKKCAAVIRYHSLHESKVYLNGFTCK